MASNPASPHLPGPMSEESSSSSPLPLRPATAEPSRSSSPTAGYEPSESTLALAHANRELSLNRPQAALELYTEVLNELDPGHPIAFFNRSLCYLLLGFPNLAVIDAYRAVFCIRTLKDRDFEDPGVFGEQLHNMGMFTICNDQHDEPWLAEPWCYVVGGKLDFLNVRLASIAAKPYIRKDASAGGDASVAKIVIMHTANDVLIKASYRLAVALWKCGGGALKSANDVVCNVATQSICEKEDETVLSNLQNAILMDMAEEMQHEARVKNWLMQTGAMKSDKATIDAYDDSGVRGLFTSEFTKIRRELYPWDEYSLSWKNQHSLLKDLNEETSDKTDGRCILVIKNDTSKAPKLVLSARQDISAATALFQDVGTLHAVTPLPRIRRSYNCDTCGSLLNIPDDLCSKAIGDALELHAEIDYRSTVVHNQAGGAYSDIVGLNSTIKPPAGFQVCPGCRRTCFCSLRCHQLSISTHTSSMCAKEIDAFFDSSEVPREWTGLVNSSAHNLLNLLLIRLIAGAAKLGEHPLDSYNMKILHGDLENPRKLPKDNENTASNSIRIWNDNSARKISSIFPNRQTLNEIQEGATPKTEKSNTMPWSFKTNVTEPIQALFRLGVQNEESEGGLELALDTQSFDGWMLETMRAKVASGMTMSKYPRFAIAFNNAGDAIARACVIPYSVIAPFALDVAPNSGASTPNANRGAEGDTEVQNSWIASLHPFYTLLDHLGDAGPNVVVVERRGALLCKAEGSRDDTAVAVLKGERLRRSDDVVPFQRGDDNPRVAFPESLDFPSFSDEEELWEGVDDVSEEL